MQKNFTTHLIELLDLSLKDFREWGKGQYIRTRFSPVQTRLIRTHDYAENKNFTVQIVKSLDNALQTLNAFMRYQNKYLDISLLCEEEDFVEADKLRLLRDETKDLFIANMTTIRKELETLK